MSISLACDICRTPKDSVRHYSLTRQWRTKAERDGSSSQRVRYAGTIDLCDDCRGRVSHDGRDSSHKVTRIEFGAVRR